MIDILYVAWNRLDFTKASFEALLANTDWENVRALYVKDDGSTDGTYEYLRDISGEVPATTLRLFDSEREGGPVAAMNAYLGWHESTADDFEEKVEMFAKIDNDFVVCPGWLPEMLRQMHLHPGVDVLGVEPMFGPAVPPPEPKRFARSARHIGGKGLIRHRIFEHCRPHAYGFNGYQGWSQYQLDHQTLSYAWIAPDLPCFGLDQLPFEPWRALTDEYEAKGWGRRWPEYLNDVNMATYWEWWL